MNYSACVASFGAVLPSGILSPEGLIIWKAGQGVLDVSRDQILDKPYPGFGKLAMADRMAFAASSVALRGQEGFTGETCGISLGIPFGSLSTDFRYMESVANGFPSPALFSATLPSSPLADIAIFHAIKGPCRVLCNAAGAGIGALEQGLSLLHCKKAASVLVMLLQVIDPADAACPLIAGTAPRETRAYAFLLCSQPSQHGDLRTLNASFESINIAESGKPEEVYFDEFLGLLSRHQSGSIPFNAAGYSGIITIEKDRSWNSSSKH